MKSKLYLLLILLFTISISKTFSQSNIEIHPRIGNEITKELKDYFCLFPYINEFKSAKLYQLNDTNYYFVIEKEINEKKIDTLKFNSKTFSEFRKIIEKYEYIYLDKSDINSFEISWNVELLKIIDPRMQYYNDKNKITILNQNNNIVEGNLIWADESVIILQDTIKTFNWRDKNYKVFHYTQIKELLSPKDCEFLGSQTIYLLNLKYLQDLSEFFEINENKVYSKVPEFQNIISQTLQNYENTKTKEDLNLNDLILSREKKLIIGIDFSISSLFQNIFEDIKLNGISKTYNNSNPNPGWVNTESNISTFKWIGLKTSLPALVIEYKIADNINLGLGINYFDNEFLYSKSEPNGISNTGYTVNLMCGYTKYHNEFSTAFIDKFETSYRIGIIYGTFDNKIHINTLYDGIRYTNINELIYNSHSIFGLCLESRISYFITDYLTIDSRILINFISPVKIENWSKELDQYHQLIIKEGNFSYTGIGLRFGLGYRI